MNAGTVNGSVCQLMESVTIITEAGTSTVPMKPELYSFRGQTFCPPSGLILSGLFKFEKFSHMKMIQGPGPRAQGSRASLPEAVRRGAATAAIVVTRVGCAPAMPNAIEVQTFMQQSMTCKRADNAYPTI